MNKDQHTTIFRNNDRGLLLKGLLTRSIPESPVPLFIDGKKAGKFQGIEFYIKSAGNNYPLIIADLISNTYFRLTYSNAEGTTATLGTSVISAPSYRPLAGPLRLIPKVTRAEIETRAKNGVEVLLFGRYDDVAEIVISKSYSLEANTPQHQVTTQTRFSVLKNFGLSPQSRGVDAFRLFSISSMFASQERYDANIIRFRKRDGVSDELSLVNAPRGGAYLFRDRQRATEIDVIKQGVSKGPKNSPGSPDSPSIRTVTKNFSSSSNELGVQGYISESLNINDDSLSVWLEWFNVPQTLERGTELNWTTSFTAFPPEN